MVTSRSLFICAWYENNWHSLPSFWRHFQFPALRLKRRRFWQLVVPHLVQSSYFWHSISGSLAGSIDSYWLIALQCAPDTLPKCGRYSKKKRTSALYQNQRKIWHFPEQLISQKNNSLLFFQLRNLTATSAGRAGGLTTPGGPTFLQSSWRNLKKNSTSTNIWHELGELRSPLRCNLTRPRWGVGKQPNNKVLKFPDDDMTDRPLT